MATAAVPRALDPAKLDNFMNQAVGDMGAALHGVIVLLGDKLGLYRAMGDGEPVTAQKLSEKTGVRERYVREWLNASAASHYVEYDTATDTYSLSPEQAFALADSKGIDLPGFYYMLGSTFKDEGKLADAFRAGRGFGWHEHDKDLFVGVERFFRPSYLANLTTSWIPALSGVEEKLKKGIRVADLGCGHGASTILMAQTYPASEFWGFDYHDASIAYADREAQRAGLGKNVHFAQAAGDSYPGTGYEFVACFDCLHDMGDPVGVARHVKETMAPDGVWMIVEPRAGDTIAENLNPVGRVFYSASTLCCVPASLAQDVGLGLGAQAGEAKIREVLNQAGFTRVRRAADTPFNMVLEARP